MSLVSILLQSQNTQKLFTVKALFIKLYKYLILVYIVGVLVLLL